MPTALALPGWGTPPARMQPICTALGDHGLQARPWDYDADGTIHGLGARLAEAITGLATPVHLVGHSLGGLVAASAVLDHGASVTSVTTVNAPWRGTWVAWTAHPHDPLGRQLRWGSTSLDDLRTALATHLAADDGPRLTTRIVPVTGHSVSLAHERMVAAVVDGVVGVPV